MLPNDGAYGQTVYAGSGKLVAAKIKEATFGKVQNSEIVETVKPEEAITYCKDRDIRFLVRPSILHWEDRAIMFEHSVCEASRLGIRERVARSLSVSGATSR